MVGDAVREAACQFLHWLDVDGHGKASHLKDFTFKSKKWEEVHLADSSFSVRCIADHWVPT